MGLFSKNKKTPEGAETAEETSESTAAETSQSTPTIAETKPEDGPKTEPTGPIDYAKIPAEDVSKYADFGVFMLPQVPGLAVHPESPLNENSFGSLTLNIGRAAVELLAVAAPKSKRLWPELRAQVMEETQKAGNTCEEREGSFGTELLVQLHARDAKGNHGLIHVRYCGVDGPNWFVRLVFNGIVDANDPDLQALEQVVRQVAVVRGSQPMSPRSLIPVVLPDELARQLASLREQQQA